jgi:ubiquinone biosynthesis accessory factor UbiJ
MNKTFPFSFLESLTRNLQPPSWVVDEGQQRLVLFINHVIAQEKQAQDRLLRQKGRIVHVRFGAFAIDLLVTPAGLVDRAPAASKPDLLLEIPANSPFSLMQAALAGQSPPVKIEGDVQLAAEVGWLADNLRWDVEEDLSRLIGDAPAHAVGQAGRQIFVALKRLLAPAGLQAGAAAPPTPAGASSFPSSPTGQPRASE